MIAHTSATVTDYEKSKALYTKILAPLGYKVQMDLPEYRAVGFAQERMDFWLGEKKEMKAAGVHVAFVAESKEMVDTFHSAALAAGATDNGAPGYRTLYAPGYYGAFVLDYDGNNIEAVWMDPSK
jgi:catechol 2,3-dioxygenase-like lactoylglutathione lyase family enzyme